MLGFAALVFVALLLYALYAGIAAFFFYIPRGLILGRKERKKER